MITCYVSTHWGMKREQDINPDACIGQPRYVLASDVSYLLETLTDLVQDRSKANRLDTGH